MNKKIPKQLSKYGEFDNPLGSQPFDTVFKTLLETCTRLIIPVINEVFHTQYEMDENIQLLSTEHYFKDEKGVPNKRVADCCVLLGEHMYHLECQTNKDYGMKLRMVEYDFHIALSQAESIEDIYTLKFPKSGVLYLRDGRKIPDHYQINLELPDGSYASYPIPILKVQEYDREAIFDKNLLFFIPYYAMRFENQMKEINDDPIKLDSFKAEYQGIYDKLVALYKEHKIDERYLVKLTDLTSDLLKVVAKDAAKVRKEVTHMGGQVVKTYSDMLFEYWKEQGIEQGMERGMEKQIVAGITRTMIKQKLSFEDACDYEDVPQGEREQYRSKVKEELKKAEPPHLSGIPVHRTQRGR